MERRTKASSSCVVTPGRTLLRASVIVPARMRPARLIAATSAGFLRRIISRGLRSEGVQPLRGDSRPPPLAGLGDRAGKDEAGPLDRGDLSRVLESYHLEGPQSSALPDFADFASFLLRPH